MVVIASPLLLLGVCITKKSIHWSHRFSKFKIVGAMNIQFAGGNVVMFTSAPKPIQCADGIANHVI
jgi:hypothetical protein